MRHLSAHAVAVFLTAALVAVPVAPSNTVVAAPPATGAAPTDPKALEFFEKKIRPVLADKCYKCHSAAADKIKGGLVLDTREGIRRGGDNGPGVVPGDLKESLVIEAIRYQSKDFSMPPQKAGGKLPDATIQDFEKWVSMGAPDPREGDAKVARKQDTWEAAKDWWAWQEPQRAAPPAVKAAAWPKTEIDRYLLAAMEAKGLQPVADADKLTLLRRAYFDLIGLPPTPQQINAFLLDTTPNAFARVVDQLLASPRFGERWGRHWLDVARYAESCGKDANIAYPHAWRYRDYVIAAFNQDKPYDEFVREQIAGDLLPAQNDKERADRLVATGFLALGTKSLNDQNPRQFALDVADEQIDATSQAFLGMTVGCARCHDHKFDPIPQKEYYSLAGIFLSSDTRYGTAAGIQNRHSTQLVELPKGANEPTLNRFLSAADRQQKEKRIEDLRKELQEVMAERRSPGGIKDPKRQNRPLVIGTQLGFLQKELELFDEAGRMKALAMGVEELPATRSPGGGGLFGRRGGGFGAYAAKFARPPEFSVINDCAVYARGDADKPGEKVPRGFLNIITHSTPPSIPPSSSGRKELAEWLTAPSNPLTSRVMVNRVWHWIFGQGIVTTTDNFGSTGQKPSNQALLDAMAVHFTQGGSSVKRLIREIVLSHAYQLSSNFDDKDFALDPENTLCWRMSKRRLEAECIRDAVLAASGELNVQPPVGSVIAQAGDGPVGLALGRLKFGVTEEAIIDSGSNLNVRSVYLPVARDVLPDALSVFDFAENSMVVGNRETTNVPSQALFLLNSPFVEKAAQKLAARVITSYPAGPGAALGANMDPRMTLAYWLVFSRNPTAFEKKAAYDFFNRFPGRWKKGDETVSAVHDAGAINAAWTSFARALFASAEFRYLN